MNYIASMRKLLALNPVEGIVTSEALCARIAGDGVAGMVLHRLLMWLPKSRRADGGIWKSDKEMEAETGFSYTQLRRARTLLSGVVISKVKRAMGSPTMHYWLNEDGFIEALAGVVKRSVIFVRSLLKMDFEKTLETITTESLNLLEEEYIPISESESSVMENAKTETEALLIKNGVNETLAATWRDVDLSVVQAYLSMAEDGKASGKIKKVAGYLVGCLRSYVSTQVGPEEEDTDKYDLLKLAKEGFEGYVVNQLRHQANWRTLDSEEQAFLAAWEAKASEWMTA